MQLSVRDVVILLFTRGQKGDGRHVIEAGGNQQLVVINTAHLSCVRSKTRGRSAADAKLMTKATECDWESRDARVWRGNFVPSSLLEGVAGRFWFAD